MTRSMVLKLVTVGLLIPGCGDPIDTTASAPAGAAGTHHADAAAPGDGQASPGDGIAWDGADATTSHATDAGVETPDAPPNGPTTASFRTLWSLQYLHTAAGGAITADADTLSDHEIFVLEDKNGGALADGDEVLLKSKSGDYLTAAGGGGGALEATATGSPWVLVRLAGPGTIASGDEVALSTPDKQYYVSAIDGGGGDVLANAPWARGWETWRIYLNGDRPPTALEAREHVLDYVNSIAGSKTVAGQHNKFNATPASAMEWIQDHTGKTPGLWSADFGFGQDAVDNRGTMIREAKRQWSEGALVQLMYHNCIPTRDELCDWWSIGGSSSQHLSDAEWNELITDGTGLNTAWKQRLDTLAVYFEQLEVAGVAPWFRPLHEMNQGVFWWGGRPGSNGTRRLFQITHDYLVQVKGLRGIIWVWNVQDFGSLGQDVVDYDPGPDYYDIATLDVYDGGFDQWKLDAIRGQAATPIGIGECAVVPSSAQLEAQPWWTFFMLWPDFLEDNGNAGRLVPLYDAPNVITRDEMPGWL